jgi:hypothetical protein
MRKNEIKPKLLRKLQHVWYRVFFFFFFKRVKYLSNTYALSQNQIATLVFKNIIYGTCGY